MFYTLLEDACLSVRICQGVGGFLPGLLRSSSVGCFKEREGVLGCTVVGSLQLHYVGQYWSSRVEGTDVLSRTRLHFVLILLTPLWLNCGLSCRPFFGSP